MKKRIDVFQGETHFFDWTVATGLALVVWLLYHPVMESYWVFEELQPLRQAYEHHPWEYFFVPKVWRELQTAFLTPWFTFSLSLDLRLFGLEPRGYYLHQLLSLWLVSVTLYFLLRLWLPRLYALTGTLLFLVSAPAAAAAEMLMVRHYVEGTLLALLSLLIRKGAAKRVAALIGLLGPALPSRHVRKRNRRTSGPSASVSARPDM